MERIQKIFCAMCLLIGMSACGRSIIEAGQEQTQTSVPKYAPNYSSDLEVIPYRVIEDRLVSKFKLATTSESYKLLQTNKSIFDVLNPEYNSLFQTTFTKVMSLACHEASRETFFPGGKPVIDNVWAALTGRKIEDGGAREIEADILSRTSKETKDVQRFGLCMAAALDSRAIFINYN